MQSLPLTPRAGARDTRPRIVERFMRDRESIWQQIGSEDTLDRLLLDMLLSSAVALGCYGAVIGLGQGMLQALASAIKLPLLFLLTPAICLPTLYLSNLLFGGRLTARQILALILASTTVTAVFTLAFAPISLFFLLTGGDYPFFVLLNVAILTLTSLVGVQFLLGGVRYLNNLPSSEPAALLALDKRTGGPIRSRSTNLRLLELWLVLYAFVGTQLGWTLRPFFGYPDLPFQLFRSIEGNFYTSMLQVIVGLFSGG